ncbi:MAG: DUF2267 domain-containing protein [Cyanobacteria bacterium P01_D01_bin.128]
MPINLREDIAYILLDKIDKGDRAAGDGEKHGIDLTATDMAGRQMTISDLLGHLDYLNQKGYIEADFTGNAYARQEDVPDVIDADTIDFRVASTLGAPDGPLPHLIRFDSARLTERGRQLIDKMRLNRPDILEQGPAVPIVDENCAFLEKVMIRGSLEDIFDARDLSEVVFRTMRDLMTNETADQVASELNEEALPTDNKALQDDISTLWKDTNPFVRVLSRIRSPLEFDGETFLRRIRQEGGLQKSIQPETAVSAVFAAVKDELSPTTISNITAALPDKVRNLWQSA